VTCSSPLSAYAQTSVEVWHQPHLSTCHRSDNQTRDDKYVVEKYFARIRCSNNTNIVPTDGGY